MSDIRSTEIISVLKYANGPLVVRLDYLSFGWSHVGEFEDVGRFLRKTDPWPR